MGTPIKPVGYIYNDKAFLSDPHPDWNPIYVLIRQSDAMAVINQQQADMRQMAGDVQAIQEIHSQQKAKLYARIAELEAENARLREDAERYLWICRQDFKDRQWVDSFDEYKQCRDRNIDTVMDMYKNSPKIDTSPERVENSVESMHVDWPEDESRIDVVGQNGNIGLHYEVKS